MPHLDVPGASLYYETVGQGPLLLCIAGASGSVEGWKALSEHLKKTFTVAMYDRRGFSRSTLLGSQDYSHRLQTDADDAAALITHLSPDEPAVVVGNSSGAIVALQLLVRHPHVVKVLMCHEPPAISLLPDCEDIDKGIQEIYQIYREHGIPPAIERFATFIQAGYERDALVGALANPLAAKNTTYWFEHELSYPTAPVDVEALASEKGKLVLLLGSETKKEVLHYRPNLVLAEKLGLEIEEVPGMHVGFVLHAEEWAKAVSDILRRRGVL